MWRYMYVVSVVIFSCILPISLSNCAMLLSNSWHCTHTDTNAPTQTCCHLNLNGLLHWAINQTICPCPPSLHLWLCGAYVTHPAGTNACSHTAPPLSTSCSASCQPIAGRSANQNCSMWVWTEPWFSVYKVCANCSNPLSDRMPYLFFLLLSSAYLFRYGVFGCVVFPVDHGLKMPNCCKQFF